MVNPTPPASWYEPPEASPTDILEEAEWVAYQYTDEWQALGEFEVWIDTKLDRGNEPVWTIRRVAHDGEVLFAGSEDFDDATEMRDWLEERFPFPEQNGDE